MGRIAGVFAESAVISETFVDTHLIGNVVATHSQRVLVSPLPQELKDGFRRLLRSGDRMDFAGA